MSEQIAPRIARLIDETGRIESESEQVYLALGRIFPQLASEMTKSADNAERSLEGFRELLAGGSISLSRAGGSGAESGVFFRSLQDRDSAFLARINDSIERLGSLDETIARVRSDSEEMEIISLNAMTVALKSGTEGKAFSVITDELKRLSGRTISLTEEVTRRGHALMESFGRLRGSLGELDSFQREFFASLDEVLTSGFRDLEAEVVSTADFFSELLTEARAVREPVLRIMQEIQLQDIVRQSLQHVGISLREAGDAAQHETEEAGSAFVSAVIELSATLVDEVVKKLGASAASFAGDMEAVGTLVSGGERRRADHLALQARSPAVDSARFAERSPRYLALKREVIATARRLASQVQGLDESFKGISALLSRFQTIVVASRIEVAKNRALQSVATTVRGMIALTDSIEADVAGAMDTTKDFIKVAIAAIAEYSSEEGDSGERLTEALERVEADVARLEQARLAVNEGIGGFSLYTPGFIALVAEARSELGKLDELARRLESVRENLAGTLGELRLEPGSPVVGEQAERLRRMVERFTIFTHKKTAADIGNFAVEEGGGAGEITLF